MHYDHWTPITDPEIIASSRRRLRQTSIVLRRRFYSAFAKVATPPVFSRCDLDDFNQATIDEMMVEQTIPRRRKDD